jgi:hypothetical protein
MYCGNASGKHKLETVTGTAKKLQSFYGNEANCTCGHYYNQKSETDTQMFKNWLHGSSSIPETQNYHRK